MKLACFFFSPALLVRLLLHELDPQAKSNGMKVNSTTQTHTAKQMVMYVLFFA